MSEDLPNQNPNPKLKRGPKDNWKFPGLKEAIIANEAFRGRPDYVSPREMSERFGCSIEAIYTYRTRLASQGLITVADNGQRYQTKKPVVIRDSQGGLVQSMTRAAASTKDLLAQLAEEGVLGPLERMKVLSLLIRTGSPMVKIAAIKAIEDLSKATEGRVGPPKPLTQKDRIARLVRLFLTVGEPDVEAAREIAFKAPLSQGEFEAPLQLIPGAVPDPPPPSPEPMPDLSPAASPS